MDTASQMEPELYRRVLQTQAEMWDALIAAFVAGWDRTFEPRWTPENRVSLDDVLLDLAYGRD